MLPIHVALVAEDSKITPGELSEVAAALQKQVTRDFGPIWGVQADVSAFPSLDHLPLDYWPIVIKDDIGDPNALGYHTDGNGQPYSLVLYDSGWTLTASHECLEMLADPFGRRVVAGTSPVQGQGRVQFLVEVCDPCEGPRYAYAINGVTVSDFYTPHYFDPVQSGGVRYSFNGSISRPREVLADGYLSWFVPSDGRWWQETWFGDGPQSGPIEGMVDDGRSIREAIDRANAARRLEMVAGARSLTAARAAGAAGGEAANFRERARRLRASIRAVTG